MRARRFRVLLTAALAAASIMVGSGAGSVAAVGSSDIPGVPLPSPVVTGQLGGPIYDVVYALQVPPAHVIVAGLTGSPGTDFDLYLFDSSATTVVNNVGVVAKSTGPTSTESISYPSRTGGTFYLDLNGATAVEGTYVLSVQIVADTTPPAISSVLLDGGSVATNIPTVSVLVAATDELSGVAAVALSADDQSFGSWLPTSSVLSWTFPAGDGPKRLWVKVQNGVGLESAPVSASIVLDTVPPAVVSVAPPRDSATGSVRPTIRVTFSEPMDPASWKTAGLALQEPTGSIVPGTLAYDGAANSGTFTPAVDLVPGTTYFATVGTVRDLAGNLVLPSGSWTLKPMQPTSVSMTASPLVVTYGTAVTFAGSASIPAGDAVTLMARSTASATFAPAAQLLPAPGFRAALVPVASATYRVDYAGSSTALTSSSPAISVTVRWSVVLTGRGPAVVRTGTTGATVAVQARVLPAAAGQTVSFRLYRYDTTLRRYVFVGSRGARTFAAGLATIAWKPAAGRWQWRAVALGTADHASNTSSAHTWSISR